MRWIKSSNEASKQLLGSFSPLRNDVESLSIKTNLASDNEKDFQSRAVETPFQSIRKSRIGKKFFSRKTLSSVELLNWLCKFLNYSNK